MRAKKNTYQNGGEQRDPRLRGGIYDGPEGNKRQYAAYKRAMEMLGPVHKSDMSEREYHEKAVDLAYDIMDQEMRTAYEAKGGQGASATEDLLERLSQYKRNAYGNKYEQGGEVKKKGSTIKIAGQYAVDSIKTTPEGNQYVSMELPDGKVVPVFGDWETYGHPNQQGLIEDLDFVIYPLGDGTYALDAAEAEADMLRAESREVSRQAGPEVEDLLQELNQRGGMGFTPSGRMRPVKRQR
jgi:hypothetical protein